MASPTRARALHARRTFATLAAAGALVAAAACRRDPAANAPPAPAAAAPELATSAAGSRPGPAAPAQLRSATTGVALVPGGAPTARARARAGEPLRPGDVLRTTWGNAELALPDGSVVRLDERSELRVVALEPGARLALVRGRVQIDPAPGSANPPRVELPEGGVAASGQGGRWAALATPGSLAIAAAKGTVRLESADGAVDVGPGTTSSARRDRAPLAPTRERAALAAATPEGEQVPPDVCAAVQGTAAPGAEVRVGGAPVEVGADGTFQVTVPRSGRGAVDVVARHASGATERRSVRCAEAALSNFEVEWDER